MSANVGQQQAQDVGADVPVARVVLEVMPNGRIRIDSTMSGFPLVGLLQVVLSNVQRSMEPRSRVVVPEGALSLGGKLHETS